MNGMQGAVMETTNPLVDFDPVASMERMLAQEQASNLGAAALNGVDSAFMDAMYQLNTAFTTLSADSLNDGQYNEQQRAALGSLATANPIETFVLADDLQAIARAENADRMHRFLIDEAETPKAKKA